jgi:hypothetical protein
MNDHKRQLSKRRGLNKVKARKIRTVIFGTSSIDLVLDLQSQINERFLTENKMRHQMGLPAIKHKPLFIDENGKALNDAEAGAVVFIKRNEILDSDVIE